jgi:hypothetical protein
MKSLFRNFVIVFVFLNVVSVFSLFSQDFKWESKTAKVEKTGFNQIVLSTELSGMLKPDLADLRIYDSTGNEVPYIQYSEKPILYKQMFKEYTIIKKEHKYDYTRLVIHNPKKSEITNFSLVIKNADVRKWLTLNASDDQKEWYALKEHYYFQSFYNDDNTSEIRVLNFPKSNYEYYELLIFDYFDNPINILKAGYYDWSVETGKYSQINNVKISQTDTLKQSIIKISFDQQQYIDKLQFIVDGPEFYFRDASISIVKSIIVKGEAQSEYEEIKPTKITSNSENVITFSAFPAKELYLIIQNFDDKPLRIKEVKAFELNHYVIANLNEGGTYSLKFGDNKLNPPIYDLKFFTDSIPDNLPQITTGNIKNIEKIAVQENKPFYSNPFFIWIVIAFVAIIIALISIKMIKEMPKKDEV